jgi:RNA polymerase sigma-70 factor (ECF subfamily)
VNDNEIISLYFQKDEDAVLETKKKYHNYCLRISNNILHNRLDAEEVVNETYLAVWNSIPPNHPSSLNAYIGKIARSLSLKRLRSESAEKRGAGESPAALDELLECIGADNNVESQLEIKELAQYVNRFLRDLPDHERRVFIRRYWYLESISDIANQSGFSESKIKSMLFRTRKRLYKFLDKENLI